MGKNEMLFFNSILNIQSFIILNLFISLSISTYASEVTLQSIDNLDAQEFRSDEGNYFKLIKLSKGCKIEARFYVSFQNILSSCTFHKNTLKSATEKVYRYHYEKDHEGSLMHLTDIYQYSSAYLNIHAPEIKKDFKKYKALFPTHVIALCNAD